VEPCYNITYYNILCSIKQGFLIILMKVFSIHFAITGEESNMYYTSSFYQAGFTYE